MGILLGHASLMIEEHLKRPFAGRLLQLGRQQICFSASQFDKLLQRHRIAPANAALLAGIADRQRWLTDEEYFGAFGFTEIHSMDASSYEGATVIHDMNSDALPEAHRLAFDCLIDGGTMEHVFHTPNFLKNVANLLRPGGRVLHICPASNSVDHGFYSFSPCLYYEYYKANRFLVDACKLLRVKSLNRVTAYDYLPPIPRPLLDGQLPGDVFYTFFAATKTAESTAGEIPQQQLYLGRWGGRSGAGTERPGLLARCKGLVRRNALVAGAARAWSLPAQQALRKLRSRAHLRHLARRT